MPLVLLSTQKEPSRAMNDEGAFEYFGEYRYGFHYLSEVRTCGIHLFLNVEML